MTVTPSRTTRAKLGELRPSQIIFAFGVGAIVDLPRLSVMVMGLDDWDLTRTRPVDERRLLATVRGQLGVQVKDLRLPPMPESVPAIGGGQGEETRIGVPVASFPRWLCCTHCRKLAAIGSGLFRLEVDKYRPDRTRYVHEGCTARRPSDVLPVRFMVACEHGHLDDFPWVRFAHRGDTTCPGNLHLNVRDASGEAVSLVVSCKLCSAKGRVMSDAFGDDASEVLGLCGGRRPHLRDHESEPCTGKSRAILLGASNLWFPVALSALSIPDGSDALSVAVRNRWAEFSRLNSRDGVNALRVVGYLRELEPWSDEEIWEAIEANRRSGPREEISTQVGALQLPEWNAFTQAPPMPVDRDFRLASVRTPSGYETAFERVVLVERLREVRALIGFSRIEPPGEPGESGMPERGGLVPLTRRAPEWALASEVRGEGLFLQISEAALQRWLVKRAVAARASAIFAAHCASRERHQRTPIDAGFPGMRFVLLHSLAHALMRQMSVECGYTLASIRERIYSREVDELGPAMAGLLLYTAAPDSEGTLGGLVRLGQPAELKRLLDASLHEAELCSSDPLCAEHDPAASYDLHGAACHGCMFVPETSCERANRYLDRAVLAAVFGHDDCAYFGGQ